MGRDEREEVPTVIEVRSWSGDWVEALDPESAIVAGRTLWEEATGSPGHPVIHFRVDGQTVRTVTNERHLKEAA